MMETLMTPNNPISNVASYEQNNAAIQDGKLEDLCGGNHDGSTKNENTLKDDKNIGKCAWKYMIHFE